LLWFALGLSLGTLVALAENCAWLPRRVSLWFALPKDQASPLMSIIGLCISQTFCVPVLFFTGLHHVGYFYISRVILCTFWFLRGIDIWHFLFSLHQNHWQNLLALFPLVVLLIGMGYIILSVHRLATGGILSHHDEAAFHALRPSTYMVKMVQFWGASLLLQALFYICFLWIS
jgi:hypothetical protein